MFRRVLIINGHPDASPGRLCAALADAYAAGAISAGHEVRRLDVGALDFSLIRSAESFASAKLQPDIARAQDAIRWAGHVVIVHPLWLGAAPALLKGFFEQVFRYGFALAEHPKGLRLGLLDGRSVRLVVTMGMPALAYRWLFGAFGVRGLERSVLRLAGFAPVRRTLIGAVGAPDAPRREQLLAKLRSLGAQAA